MSQRQNHSYPYIFPTWVYFKQRKELYSVGGNPETYRSKTEQKSLSGQHKHYEENIQVTGRRESLIMSTCARFLD